MDRIDRVVAPSVAEFERNFLSQGRPVIIQGALSGWPALREWTIGGLASKVEGVAAPIKSWNDHPDTSNFQELELASFLHQVQAGRSDKTEAHYLFDYRILERNQPINRVGELLRADLGDLPYIPSDQYGNTSLFVGDDVETGMHFHHRSEAFLLLVHGRKSVVMIDPRHTSHLDKGPGSLFNSSASQFKHSSRPNYRSCDESWAQRVDLEPGELLYIPLHWWHYVFAQEPHISLTYWFGARWRDWKWTPVLAPSLFEIALAKRPFKLGWVSRLRRRAAKAVRA